VTRLPRHTVYLLIAREDGTIYTGYTSNLRRRFKQHNSPENTGWTKGRTWHLLGVRSFLDRDTALLFERRAKNTRTKKRWINRLGRARVLCDRYGIQCAYFD
jgi:predicted GIY-YIG superfamily endonuclease